jgi:hypothetical protein
MFGFATLSMDEYGDRPGISADPVRRVNVGMQDRL